MQIELISSPAEFWDKVRTLIVQLELVSFKTYQQLGFLFRKVRRIVIKDTKLGDVNVVFKETGSSRVTKARYSQAAVLLQNDGWTITDKNNGPVLVLPKK